MAARQEDSFMGIAPGGEYLLFRTEDIGSEYRIEEFNWTVAAEKADSAGADVINTSLGYSYGFTDPGMDYSYDEMDGQTAMISRAAAKAVATGMVVVVSAGNEGSSSWRYMTAPADTDGVLAVGALAADSTIAPFSSLGPTADDRIKPDVVSLGVGVPVINSEGDILNQSGTSFASPIMAGYAALLLQQYPSLTGNEIFGLIRDSGNQAVPDNTFGFGISYIEIVLSSEPVISDEKIRIFPVPARSVLYWHTDQPVDKVNVFDLLGRIMDVPGSSSFIDVSVLRPGIYIIRFVVNGSVRQFRFVKE
ncbi:MAG: S8 family peptidase [Cyclobacteriaceae bacterium]